MNALLISESFIIREALEHLLEDFKDIYNIEILKNVKDIKDENLENINVLIIDMKDNSCDKIEFLKKLKSQFNNIKVMSIDLSKDKNVCKNVISIGVEAYIVDIIDKEDFRYLIKRILDGKKTYEADLVKDFIIESCDCKLTSLTKREVEVLDYIVQGLDNKEIADLLYITEYTVKKHVSNVLRKLNLRNRKEIIVNLGNS